MENKFNKDIFVRQTLWDMYVKKECDMHMITDSNNKGETISEKTFMIMSYRPSYHTHKLTYEEYYIWAWQPIVPEKTWQKSLINSYIEHRKEEPDFDIFDYCCDEVLQLKKEIEEDKKRLSEKEFNKEYYWSR